MAISKRARRATSEIWRPETKPGREAIQRSFVRHVQGSLGRDSGSATPWDRFHALDWDTPYLGPGHTAGEETR